MLQYVGIRAGSTFITSGGIQVPVARIIEHDSYNVPTYLTNDIALMFLASALTFGSGIQPITLPPQGEIIQGGTIATVSGWGATEQGGSAPDILQIVTVSIVDLETCTEAYEFVNPVNDGMICAGSDGLGSCGIRDSGGPLLVNGVLHGIVSWGLGCAPAVNVRVAYYRNWIDSWDL